MKKILIISVIFSLTAANIFAQKYNMKEKISYEIRGGMNFLNVSHNIPKSSSHHAFYDYAKDETYSGFNAGILVNLPFLENINLQTGLLICVNKSNLGYAQFPLLISYQKSIAHNLKWNLFGGGYNFSFGIEALQGPSGFLFGTGLYYKKLYLGIQYDIGMYNLVNHLDNDMFAKTRVFSIMTGYKF